MTRPIATATIVRRAANNALAKAAVGLVVIAVGAGGAAAQTLPDDTDYGRLHLDWQRFLPRGSECAWPTYYVDREAPRGRDGDAGHYATVDDALAAAADDAVCGPTIFLSAGRYEIGQLVLSKPTIFRGQGQTELVGSIVNVSALPLWLERLVLADAPFPGAVFAVHPAAETTLVDVTIANATGFGAVVHGGSLEMRQSRIEGSRTATRTEAARSIGRLASMVPPSRPYSPSHLGWLREVVHALPPGVLGPDLPLDFRVKAPLKWGKLLQCSGTGLYVSGGVHVVLGGDATFLTAHARAGLVAVDPGTYVEGQHVWAQLNGVFGPPPNANAGIVEGAGCVGGIQVERGAFVNLTGVHANANQSFGVIIGPGGLSFLSDIEANSNGDVFDLGVGHGLVGYQGTLQLQNFSAYSNLRAGLGIVEVPHFVLFGGTSSQNRFGIVTDVCDIEDYLPPHNVSVVGNDEQDIALLGCPLPVPEPPPAPGSQSGGTAKAIRRAP